ncbi:MAG: glycerol-3-phosphate acyltransferase [Actinomycetota bacterium]
MRLSGRTTSVIARLSAFGFAFRSVRGIGRIVAAVFRRRSGRFGVALVAGYLLGTFPTADIVARRAGHDLRNEGSGNPGGANAMKVVGTSAGVQVMGGDIAKGAAASMLGGALAGPAAAHLAGTAAVAGHCHPIWNGGRGGKGVAASVGQCLATFPAYFPIDAAIATATAAVPAWKQRAFAATAVSSACWVVGGVVWWRTGWRNLWGPRPTVTLPVSAALSSALIIERFLAAGPVVTDADPAASPDGRTAGRVPSAVVASS